MDNDGRNGTRGCNSYTVGNSVSGTVTVSDGTISSAVGFSVTQSFTRGQSYSLAPGSDWFGEFESASVFSTKNAQWWIGWTYRWLHYADH